MKKYILSIDQGTTSSRAILINHDGVPLYQASRPLECLYPKPGWVEVNADKLWISVVDIINEILIVSGATMDEIASIGITNQRETTVIWDKKTGRAVRNAIVWQSKQTQALCDKHEVDSDLIQEKTGLRINPYFSASKIRFILDSIPNGQERAEKGELLFGTVDTWLIYKMTEGKSHFTDVSNASRTLLFNIFDMKWDDELLKMWNIPSCILPEVKDNIGDFGEASFFEGGVHINGVAGDQQAALFGQCCYNVGESKNTYGTGCFMLMNIGEKPFLSKKGLLTTVAWRLRGVTTYALEGSVFIGGAVVQWLRDEMALFKNSSDCEEYVNRVKDTAGVYFVPAFVGLGTPYWDDNARGACFGLTRGSDRHHIARAALLSIAYQCKDVIETMKEEAHLNLKDLRVDGGASANKLLMQFQADILDCKVSAPKYLETTALGAGYMAGLGSGFWESRKEIYSNLELAQTYQPRMNQKEIDKLYNGWKKAIEATRVFRVTDDE